MEMVHPTGKGGSGHRTLAPPGPKQAVKEQKGLGRPPGRMVHVV